MKQRTGNLSLSIGRFTFPEESIQSANVEHKSRGSHILTEATASVRAADNFRWDYRATSLISSNGQPVQTGVCLLSEESEGGLLLLELADASWHLKHMYLRPYSFFGMSPQEIVYWLVQLTEFSETPPSVGGLTLEDRVRPFMFAIPLVGLTVEGSISWTVGDVGIVGGDYDNMFSPLVEKLGTALKDLPEWERSIPKVWGVVLARSPLEADRLGRLRAQVAADILNFSIGFGASHFETRHSVVHLEWEAEMLQGSVHLAESILVREAEAARGWLRSFPLVNGKPSVGWAGVQARARFFFEKFQSLLSDGDLRDQQGERQASSRERKIASGVRRALRWYGIASKQVDLEDKFIAAWIALEAVLDCMDYPGVFAGERQVVADRLRASVREAVDSLPRPQDEMLSLSSDLLESRLRQGSWPFKRKLKIFAASFGIPVSSSDEKLVGSLARRRARILHGGFLKSRIEIDEIRELQYLIERLITAASVHAYQDIE